MAFDGENCGLLLPWFAARNDWTEKEYIAQVRAKAGIAEQTCGWRRFDVKTWCADADGALPVRGAFKDAPSEETTPALVRRLTTLTLSYVVRNQRRDGTFFFRYRPAENILSGDSDLPRMAHAAWVLARAARAREQATFPTTWWIDRSSACWRSSKKELTACGCVVPRAGRRFRRCRSYFSAPVSSPRRRATWSYGRDSRTRSGPASTCTGESSVIGARPMRPTVIRTTIPARSCWRLPPRPAEASPHRDPISFRRARRYYRHRFRYKRDFGQASWWAQASAAWYAITSDPEWAEFAFEIGNSLLPDQSNRSGEFLSDSPGDSTMLYLEAVGAAIRTANAAGDVQARDRFVDAWCRGLSFLERLVYQSRDGSLLPNPAFAIGGVRLSDTTTEVRTDFVQHLASALLDASAFLEPTLRRSSKS